jgi:hypothetical protein
MIWLVATFRGAGISVSFANPAGFQMPDVQFSFGEGRTFFGSDWLLDDSPPDLSTL